MQLNSKFYEFVKKNPELDQRFILRVDHSSEIYEEIKFLRKVINLFTKKEKTYTSIARAIFSNTRQIENLEIEKAQAFKYELTSDLEEFALNFVKKFGKNLRRVSINGKSRNNFVIPFLRNVPNVASLRISNIIYKNAIKPYHPPEFLNLKELTYDSFFSNVDDDFIAIFDRVTTIRKINLLKSEMDSRFFVFLSKQIHLKELTIITSGSREFLKLFGTKCPFTLKKLSISDKSFYEEDFFLMANFIGNQNKIESLNIEVGRNFDHVLCQAILNLPRLKELYLDLIDFQLSEKLPMNNKSVKSLRLSISSLVVVQKFVGVQNLKLIAYKDDFVPIVFLDELKDLKWVSLEVNVTSLKQFITLPLCGHLKELVLNHVFGTDLGWKAIFLNNPNIEILKMVNCGFNDEHNIFEANAKYLSNLRKLYCSFYLSPNLVNSLKRNCKHLKQIWSQLGRIQATYTKVYQREVE